MSDHRKALEEENAPVVDSDEDDPPCTDLILVIHGIGQQLATQYESYNFVYAANQLRQLLRKQASNPALASIIRDRRAQVLPVQWRALLDLDAEKTKEDEEHDMFNKFTMNDITINKSIPYVRAGTQDATLGPPQSAKKKEDRAGSAVSRSISSSISPPFSFIPRLPSSCRPHRFLDDGNRHFRLSYTLSLAFEAEHHEQLPPLRALRRAVGVGKDCLHTFGLIH
uniref:Uncharacterized protein n=1 Tax=Tremella fuciformis TaxID=64657 RepID=D5KXZ2_9TREE|nr:unknown [Tremella fuciformis]